MSQCDNFILSNSTFSWWGAYLGETEQTRIIRPAYHFAGPLQQSSDWKDYYPERWTRHDHVDRRVDLSDVAFTIPVNYDHTDRKQNLNLSICMLQKVFSTTVIVGEQGAKPRFQYQSEWCRYHYFEGMNVFHRTRMLNELALMATTPIIANWDADIFIPPMQILEAVEMIRNHRVHVSYPYDGRFARVPRQQWFKKLERCLDAAIFAGTPFKGMGAQDRISVGGAVFFQKQAFIDGGMENEHMISYAPEDQERWHRFLILGFSVARVKGPLYHMDHWRGTNSIIRNPFYKSNQDEWQKVKSMPPHELKLHVASWPWLKSVSV